MPPELWFHTLQVDLKQFEGMAVQHARKNKEQEEDDLDLKNRRAPKTQKDKALKEVKPPDNPHSLINTKVQMTSNCLITSTA